MEHGTHGDHPLKLIDGNTDAKDIATRQYCAELTAGFRQFLNGKEKALHPGMLAQWKPGMKNRRFPDYDKPMIVVERLEPPIIDATFDSGSIYFRERLDIVLGFVDDDDEFCLLHYDSRRFQTFAAD